MNRTVCTWMAGLAALTATLTAAGCAQPDPELPGPRPTAVPAPLVPQPEVAE